MCQERKKNEKKLFLWVMIMYIGHKMSPVCNGFKRYEWSECDAFDCVVVTRFAVAQYFNISAYFDSFIFHGFWCVCVCVCAIHSFCCVPQKKVHVVILTLLVLLQLNVIIMRSSYV